MTFNSAIDVAIGLIMMYLVLSLVCTTINEYIATVWQLRAKTLASGLEKLIDDTDLHRAFNDHGLVDGAKAALGQRLPSYVDGKTFAMAILGSLDPSKPIPVIDDVRQALQRMPDSNIRDALLAQVAATTGDIQQLRDNVATWFDGTMDRVGGLYKKNLKAISFGVGLAIAIVVNADSVVVAKALWNDPTLRAEVASAASKLEKVKPEDKQTAQAIADSMNTLRPLPLGWSAQDLKDPTSWSGAKSWVLKVMGLFMTAVALSLGAPFWFDLLSKFMNVRGSGEKPQRTAAT